MYGLKESFADAGKDDRAARFVPFCSSDRRNLKIHECVMPYVG